MKRIKRAKNIVIVCLAMLTFSCSKSDDSGIGYQTLLSVVSAELPDSTTVNSRHAIKIMYNKPTNCHIYTDMYYINEGNQSTMAVISTYTENTANCLTINEIAEASFKFEPKTIGTHKFRFWQGKDASNVDQYIDYEVEVTN